MERILPKSSKSPDHSTICQLSLALDSSPARESEFASGDCGVSADQPTPCGEAVLLTSRPRLKIPPDVSARSVCLPYKDPETCHVAPPWLDGS